VNLECRNARKSMWDFVAGSLVASELTDAERGSVAMHMEACRECTLHRLEVQSLRTGLRHLPQVRVSGLLNAQLRVLASKERWRNETHRDWRSRFEEARWRVGLFVDNLLKPFAVPAAGGLLASFFCFFIIVDTLHITPSLENDVPVGLYTEVMIDELSPFGFHGRDVMVQLTVDAEGKVTDFEVLQAEVASLEEVRDIGNLVLFSTFTPATRFGQRVSSKRLFAIRHISVTG